jgi:hypothetical protein
MNDSTSSKRLNLDGDSINIGHDVIGGDVTKRDEIHAQTVTIHNYATNAPETIELKPLAFIPTRGGSAYIERGNVRMQLLAPLGGISAIVSVFAPGGVGKSEMANVLAAQIGHLYEKVLPINFGVKSVDQVLDDIARAVGLIYSPRPDKVRELSSFLFGHHFLFLFDDVRAENEGLFNDFVPPAQNSTLITSRLMHLPHKIPNSAYHPLPLMNVEQARALLASALMHTRLDAEPDATKTLIVLCHGNPLALDIASRRILEYRDLKNPIALFVSKLEKRLSELQVGHDARLNLYAVFDESYEPLAPENQARFRRLAVFANTGFSVVNAARLWEMADDDAENVLREFQNLSLVTPTDGATLRYRAHDLLDDYAMHKLRAEKEEHVWRDKHAE